MMRTWGMVLGWVLMGPWVIGQEYPDPKRLPSRAELPDPTIAFDGSVVRTREQWERQRKPELQSLFEHYMYGVLPPKPERVSGRVLFEEPKAFSGKGTLREVELTVGPEGWPKIYVLLVTPNRPGASGVFVGPNFSGNHSLVADSRVRIPTSWIRPNYPGVVNNRATEAGRGKILDVWPFEMALERGYAVATFYHGDVQPDRPDVPEGLRGVLFAGEAPRPGHATATIASWAWGVHRAVDYLLTRPEIDAQRIAAVGHSRLGKTVLLAAAFDPRITLVIPHQAGCGGSAPSRHNDPKAETVQRINTSFPHWFCAHFKAFNDDPSRLPFDQNGLVALCAPRPVLFTNAVEDLWANPAGQFRVLQAAEPAYRLYGVEGLGAAPMPPVGKLLNTRLGYFIREGKHSMTPADWTVFMDFADHWWK